MVRKYLLGTHCYSLLVSGVFRGGILNSFIPDDISLQNLSMSFPSLLETFGMKEDGNDESELVLRDTTNVTLRQLDIQKSLLSQQ